MDRSSASGPEWQGHGISILDMDRAEAASYRPEAHLDQFFVHRKHLAIGPGIGPDVPPTRRPATILDVYSREQL